MESDEVGAEGIVSLVVIDDTRKVKWINTRISIETKTDVAATNSVRQLLIFVFWIDNDHIAADHHRAERFKLHSK
ncbi:hypothetical protein D3C72_2322970 [compost metagenome]